MHGLERRHDFGKTAADAMACRNTTAIPTLFSGAHNEMNAAHIFAWKESYSSAQISRISSDLVASEALTPAKAAITSNEDAQWKVMGGGLESPFEVRYVDNARASLVRWHFFID